MSQSNNDAIDDIRYLFIGVTGCLFLCVESHTVDGFCNVVSSVWLTGLLTNLLNDEKDTFLNMNEFNCFNLKTCPFQNTYIYCYRRRAEVYGVMIKQYCEHVSLSLGYEILS